MSYGLHLYHLKNTKDENRIDAKFSIVDSSYSHVDGICTKVNSWDMDGTPIEEEFVADVYCKWDACTHWYFRGENFRLCDVESTDSYYHLCGADIFKEHIVCMCFIWKTTADVLKANGAPDVDSWYYELGVKELIDFVLKDYIIEEA